MTIWPPAKSNLARPAYRSLADCAIAAIERGELRIGARMPTHRDLAYQLKISVQTVSRAYDRLIRQGYLSGEVGRGTFVRSEADRGRTPYAAKSSYGQIIEMSLLKPVFDDRHVEAMKAALHRLASNLPLTALASFRESTALARFRRTSEDWLGLCGETLRERVMVPTNGTTPALSLAFAVACRPGDIVACEATTHHTLRALASTLGLQLRGLAMDEDGLDPSALERLCRTGAVSSVFLMPNAVNPLAITMSEERRRRIVAIARRHDLSIIENDGWGPIQDCRQPNFSSLAPERVFWCSGLSKCLMPGVRAGFLTAPQRFENDIATRNLSLHWMATPLMLEIVAGWIADGTATRLLEFQKDALRNRNAIARDRLRGLPFLGSRNGLHVWLDLPEAWSEDHFVSNARFHGVAVAPGGAFAVNRDIARRGVRICLGADQEAMTARGLEIIANLWRSEAAFEFAPL